MSTRLYLLASCLLVVSLDGCGGGSQSTSPPDAPHAAVLQGIFVSTGSMTVGRSNHTATLLGNGKVLISGGLSISGSYDLSLATAELFDPATGTFTATGSMTAARRYHTATLLPSGKVLIAGGYSGSPYGQYLASAELYDSETGTFKATGSMTAPRGDSHTATLLPSGKVLVAGGSNDISAELCDPEAGTFAATGSLTEARNGHTSTLLGDGQVLIVGGVDDIGALASAELYDPSAGTFSATGSMTVASENHTATLLDNGDVLIVGGEDGNGAVTASAGLYDPASGAFTAIGEMVYAMSGHTATLLQNGSVLITGGYGATAELYTGAFTLTGSMTEGRYDHTATLLPSGKVLIAGGGYTAGPLSSAELYE